MDGGARATFRAFVIAVVPEAAGLDEDGWIAVESVVERALGMRPPKVRRQIGLLLAVLELLSVFRYGRTFPALDASRRAAVLGFLEQAPSTLVRRGIWGLRTLAYMGYYTRPEIMAELGYRAHAAGWAHRAGT